MKLIPATAALVRAEINDRGGFARLLDAMVPDNWPPDSIADALPFFVEGLEAAPDCVGWFNWYALTKGTRGAVPVLIASGGFKGPPQNGTVEIGYSVLPQFQRRGYATELVGGLVRWAMEHSDVARVVAETERTNLAAMRVLIKAGFASALAMQPDHARFEFLGGV